MKVVVYLTLFILGIILSKYLLPFDCDYHHAHDQGVETIDNIKCKENDAVMFDIDHTVISGSKSIQPIIDLVKYVKSKGLAVIFITARPLIPGMLGFTKNQLDRHDIPWDEVHICPAHLKKTLKHKLDYNFVMSVGDNWTDVDGVYSGKSIKLKQNDKT